MSKSSYGKWLIEGNNPKPLYIAGPCSAETREQVLDIAGKLQFSKATVFRAGVWKPRTRPGSFEGVGEAALPWLKEVKESTGLKIAIEVAKPKHVELALKYDIDILWIGARSSVNPFTVQELADSLRGIKNVILVKNPVIPDLDLWIGAIERLMKRNVHNIGVIHRGFASYSPTNYRNQPNWQIPLDFKNKFPEIPMICDPSHICGRRDCIEKISQTALDLQYDGLMIETHNNPDKALSDSQQQITPETFKEISERLIVRYKDTHNRGYKEQLDNFRTQIDSIDIKLIELLNERMSVVSDIGKLKIVNNIAVFQQERFKMLLENMVNQGMISGLSHEFILGIYKEIHLESIRIQEKIFTSDKNSDQI